MQSLEMMVTREHVIVKVPRAPGNCLSDSREPAAVCLGYAQPWTETQVTLSNNQTILI